MTDTDIEFKVNIWGPGNVGIMLKVVNVVIVVNMSRDGDMYEDGERGE